MADCDCLGACPFFNDRMPDTGGMGAIYKRKYCQGDSARCARHQVKVALGKAKVPGNLYPNMWDLAQQIIATG